MGNKVVNDVSNSTIHNPNSPLPEGWRWMRLGECKINPSRPRSFSRGSDAQTTFVPMAAVDEKTGTIARPEVVPYSKVSKGYTYFEENDVLFAKITPCMQNGKHAIAKNLIDGLGFGTTEFHVIRPNNEVLPKWIHFFIRQPYFLREATAYFTGAVGQQRVPESFMADYPIPLPPLPEQKRIAAKVQELMVEVEHAHTACEARLEAARALPSAYLRQVFESEEAKKWERTRLGEVGPVRDGDWILNTDYRPSGVRLLQVGDVGLGRFVGKSSRFIGMERANELNCTFLEPGDILISRMPDPIGRACLLPDLGYPCITAVDVSIWRPRLDKADRQYLTYYLSCSEWISRVGAFASGATRARISRSNLEALEVPLPPLPEQKRIAAELKDKMAYAEKLKASIEKQLETIKALPQAILREAFLGEL